MYSTFAWTPQSLYIRTPLPNNPFQAFTYSTFLWCPQNLYTLPPPPPHQILHIHSFPIASTKSLYHTSPSLSPPQPIQSVYDSLTNQLCHILHANSSRRTPILHLLQKLFHTILWIPSTSSHNTFSRPLSDCSFTAFAHLKICHIPPSVVRRHTKLIPVSCSISNNNTATL